MPRLSIAIRDWSSEKCDLAAACFTTSVQRNLVFGLAVLIDAGKRVVSRGNIADPCLKPAALGLGQRPHQPANGKTLPISVLGIVAAGIKSEDLFQDFQIVRDRKAVA